MRDLEQSVGIHRRLSGCGKSRPNDPFGIFDFRMSHNPHAYERKVVCTVRVGQGWECLNILVHQRPVKRWMPRPPTHAEIVRFVPLFFTPDEKPLVFYDATADPFLRTGLSFWLSQRVRECVDHLPAIGEKFSLTKK
jgi:hypothetical protein